MEELFSKTGVEDIKKDELTLFYMKEALKDTADEPFRIPQGIKLVRINHKTGKPASPDDASVIFEALKPDFDFNSNKQRIIGNDNNLEENRDSETSFDSTDDEGVQIGTQY